MTRKLLVLIPILAVALAVMWASPKDTKASTFDPFFGPNDFYTLTDTNLNAHPDIRAQFNTLQPSANFSGLFGRAITFGDPAVTNASAAAIPGAGAYMGQLDSVAYLGLANEGCNTVVPVTFNFVEANTAVTALAMTPGVTLTAAIASSGVTSFNYTSTGDPIGPPSGASLGGQTRAEIQIDSERILVTDINQSTNTYGSATNPIVRGWNGTTPAAHSAGATISKVNVIFPSGPPANLLANLAEDDGDLDNNGNVEFPSMANNGVADGAEAIPSFIRDSFIASGNPATNDMTQVPLARYFGVAFVANSLIVTLQFVIGDIGAVASYPNLDWADAQWGYSSTTFLQDPNAPPSNSAITDFCNFTSTTLLFGTPHDNQCTPAPGPAGCTGAGAGFTLRLALDNGCPAGAPTNPNECGLAGQTFGICPSGCPRTTNPATAQRVRYYQYSVSQRDYDYDGVENALDTCANIVNVGWDPRASNALSGGDTDGDGLPNACDPAPAVFNNDQDNDLWVNRLDNCPLVANTVGAGGGGGTDANTFQFDFDRPLGSVVNDGGPNSDSIGPACDTQPNSCMTDANPIAPANCTTLTATGANGHYHATGASDTICIGGVNTECSFTADDDGDGVVNAIDTCRAGANPPYVFGGGGSSPPTWTAGANTNLSAAAGAGATSLTVASSAGFFQGNPIVIANPAETLRYIASVPDATHLTITSGLSSAHASGASSTVRMVSYAQSLRDMTNDGFVDISDVQKLTGVFGARGGDPTAAAGYQGRYDTNYDNFVDISDVQSLTGMFGAACGP